MTSFFSRPERLHRRLRRFANQIRQRHLQLAQGRGRLRRLQIA